MKGVLKSDFFKTTKKTDLHNTIRFVSLFLIVVTLPFSVPINSVCIMLLGAHWLVERDFRNKWLTLKNNKVALLFMGLYVLNVIGMVYTSEVKPGLSDLEAKLSILVFPLILGSVKTIGRSAVNKLLISFVLACTAGILICLGRGLYYLFYHHSDQFLYYHSLSAAINMHAIYFGLYLSFSLFILWEILIQRWAILSSQLRGIIIIWSVLIVVTILLLSSKTIIVSLLLFADIFLILIFVKGRKKKLGLSFVILLNVLFIISVVYVPFIRERFLDSIKTNFSTIKNKEYNIVLTGISMRTGIWNFSLDILQETNSWIQGVGTGDSQKHLDEMYVRNELYIGVPGTEDRGYLGYNAHNQYVQFLLCLGVIGFLYFLVYLAFPVMEAYRRNDYLFLAFLLFFAASCLTESMLCRQKGVVFYAMFSSLFLFHRIPITAYTSFFEINKNDFLKN